jgi:hypothetical protein
MEDRLRTHETSSVIAAARLSVELLGLGLSNVIAAQTVPFKK